MRRRRLSAALIAAALAGSLPACSRNPATLTVGAVYPLGGQQGPGGIDELRGVRIAAELMNADGGIRGRRVVVRALDVPGPDAAPEAIERLAGDGVRLVLGSYGSTVSRIAASESARRGMLFWETGAVGEMSAEGQGNLVFRVAPTGAVLGRTAVEFISERYAPKLGRKPQDLRFAVASVDDDYGRSVADGALAEIRDRGLNLAGAFPYEPRVRDMTPVVKRLAAAKPDVVFVASYLDDAVEFRREMVRQHVPIVAGIGTSSSYCMHEFGQRLGAAAVGLFASDKPDATLSPAGLSGDARVLLRRADRLYERRYGDRMHPPALAGLSAAWALFRHVLPAASSFTPRDVSEAALQTRLPRGALPNGSGVEFAGPEAADAGANRLAASVIWEWVRPGERVVVWPPEYATAPIQALRPLA